MTDYNDKARAVILAALMVFSVFAGTVAFTGTAAATNATASNTTIDATADAGSSDVIQRTTFEDTVNPGDGQLTLTQVSLTQTSGALTADDVDQVQLQINDSGSISSVASTNPSDLSSITLNQLNSATGPWTTNNGNLTLNQGASGDLEIQVTLASGAAVEGDSVTFDTTYTAADGGENFSGDLTTTQPTGTLSLGTVSGGADNRALETDGSGDFDTENGEGAIFPGATVFQGETDVELGNSFDGTPTKVTGNDEGVPLELPNVPQDQATGRYTDSSDNEVTVITPRVSTFDIENSNDEDISGGSVPQGTETSGSGDLTALAEWNYDEAEDLELTVENDDGLEVTGDALESGEDAIKSGGDVSWEMDLSDLNTGTYTFTVEGSDDLDFGDASQSTTVTITGDDDVSLDLDEDTVTRGQDVTYTVRGSNAGDNHVVTIDSDDFRDGISGSDAARVFRQVGDTNRVGVVAGGTVYNRSDAGSAPAIGNIDYAFANLTVDDDSGVANGQIDTSQLDTTDVDVDVYAAGETEGALDGLEPEDDPSLTVEEGDVTIESPGSTYVVGSEVDVNGTASEGVEDVVFYVRREGDYEHLEIDGDDSINVDADNTFEQEDVILSSGGSDGANTLSLPGTYRFGVIDAADVGGANNPENSINVSQFNTGTSAQQSIRVVDTELSATVNTVGGQVSQSDSVVNITGVSLGTQQVDVVFFDERGNANHETINVDDDNTFDEDEVSIGDLETGQVSVHVLAPGRDGDYGDGSFPETDELSEFVEDNLSEAGLTGDQMRARLLDQTTEEVASDDRIVTANFRLSDSRTSIGSVYPEGMEASGVNPVGVDDTMVVEGTTNLRPDDNSITAELQTQGGDSVALTTTDEWSYDGTWSVMLELEDVQTGTYNLEADDGDNTDLVEVEIVQSVETATPEPTATDEPTPTDTATAEPTPEPTATAEPTATDTATATDTTTGGGPGFGAIVAVIALIAAALLAVRRDN